MRDIWHPRFPFDPARLPFFYGWAILVCTTLAILSSIPGQTVGVSVYTDTYIEVLGIKRIHLTTAYLLGTGASGFIVTAGGRIFDRLGARKFIVYSCFCFGLTLLFMSQIDRISFGLKGLGFTPVIAPFVVSAIGFLGIRFMGQGMVTLGARSMLSKWWNKRRGQLVSFSGVLMAFGFSSAPRILDWEMSLLGWRGSLIANALILMFGITFIGWFLFRDNPEECGLEMDGNWLPVNRKENPDTLIVRDYTLKEALKTYSYWVITLSTGIHSAYATSYTFHVLDLAREFSVEREMMLNFFIFSAVLSVSTNLVAGYIVDRIRFRYIITAFCFGGMFFCFGLLQLPSVFGIAIMLTGMGISWGAFPILTSVGYARFFGREHLGAITGSGLKWMIWGSAVGPLAFSVSKEYLGGYPAIIIISGVLYGILAVGSTRAENPQRKLLQENRVH